MNRAIKFKLKNGKVVTIRRIRGKDYEDMTNIEKADIDFINKIYGEVAENV